MTLAHGSLLAPTRARQVAGDPDPGPERRTLRSVLLRVFAPRLVLFAVTTTLLGLARLVSVHPSAQSAVEQVPSPMPSWTVADQRAHPGCVPSASWPEGRPADAIVVYSFRDQARREVAFAEAWEWNHNHTEVDDIWVLGVCPGSREPVAPLAGSS